MEFITTSKFYLNDRLNNNEQLSTDLASKQAFPSFPHKWGLSWHCLIDSFRFKSTASRTSYACVKRWLRSMNLFFFCLESRLVKFQDGHLAYRYASSLVPVCRQMAAQREKALRRISHGTRNAQPPEMIEVDAHLGNSDKGSCPG